MSGIDDIQKLMIPRHFLFEFAECWHDWRDFGVYDFWVIPAYTREDLVMSLVMSLAIYS
jgi:hypothetical protein